jgi:hypothetical protein
VQYVDRAAGTGLAQAVVHGTVECLRVEGNRAEISGEWNDDSGAFHILVVDNGEGAGDDNDIVTVSDIDDPSCDEDDDDDDGELRLARGNAQVYDAP